MKARSVNIADVRSKEALKDRQSRFLCRVEKRNRAVVMQKLAPEGLLVLVRGVAARNRVVIRFWRMAAVASMPAVHEDMHERAGE